MEGNQKPRKSFRILSPFRPKKTSQESSIPTISSPMAQVFPMQITESVDTQNTRNRYKDAVKFLQDAIENRGGERWRSLHLSKFGGEMDEFHDSQLRERIDEALKILGISIKDQDALGKCRHIIQCVFTALSPLAKHLLTIASTAANVIFRIIFLLTSG